jgi:hypothetical protein
MKPILMAFFRKKSLHSLPLDELRRLVLLGENKERALQRQIDAKERMKETLFNSVTNVPSSEREKRFAAQKIESMERTITGIDRALQMISAETRFVQRVLEMKEYSSKHSSTSLLSRFSLQGTAKLFEERAIEDQMQREDAIAMEQVFESTSEASVTAESSRVMEILRHMKEVSEKTFEMDAVVGKSQESVMKDRNGQA